MTQATPSTGIIFDDKADVLFESAPIAYLIVEPSTRVLQANAAARALFPSLQTLDPPPMLDEQIAGKDLRKLTALIAAPAEAPPEVRLHSAEHDDHWFAVSVILLGAGRLLLGFSDKHALKEAEEVIRRQEFKYKTQAQYDPLTRLPNRTLLDDRLEQALSYARRHGSSIAICMIDLDGFKEVNDTYGHDTGDRVLIEAGDRMKRVVRDNDTIARLGGDEFIVIFTDLARGDDCAVMLFRLLNVLADGYHIGDQVVTTVSASIGVTLFPDDNVPAESLLRHADIAMYQAKKGGKNRFSFFDADADRKIRANYKTINRIKRSLGIGEFQLYFQPKVHTQSGRIKEVEALARWHHPMLGLLPPKEFLPLIENDAELNNVFDEWVIIEAMDTLEQWHRTGLRLKICVNISSKQFRRKDFISWLESLVARSRATESMLAHLAFEIRETVAIENLNQSCAIMQECKRLGVTFAIDDFGTGYSSMLHLKELPIDTIKIARPFVSGMLSDSSDMVIVQAIVALGSAFDIKVTAQGVETIEQIMLLLDIGCDELQGFAIARPLTASELRTFIAEFTPDPRWKIVTHNLPTKADFELLLAGTNHNYWVDKIFEALEQNPVAQTLPALEPTQCRFGKWFEKVKTHYCDVVPEFNTVNAVHRELHDTVRAIHADLLREGRSISAQERSRILALSRELSRLLDAMRREMASVSKKHNLVNKILEKRSHLGK